MRARRAQVRYGDPHAAGRLSNPSLIGRGAMGVVYEAIQEPLGRHVALKVLTGNHLANPVLMERFRLEARAAASLHHTNIVPVFDVGEQDGTHYYAMQFIQGQSLYAVIQELRRLEDTALRQNPPEESKHPDKPHKLDVENGVRSIAEGLINGRVTAPQTVVNATEPEPASVRLHEVPAAPHPLAIPPPISSDSVTSSELSIQSARTVFPPHRLARDPIGRGPGLCPRTGNCASRREALEPAAGRRGPRVDYRLWPGQSRRVGRADRDGRFRGHVSLHGAERFNGKSDAVSDVYSLGVTLYELATRQPAFSGINKAQVLLTIAKKDPPRPRQRDARVPRDLETIIVKAMDKSPSRRYQSAIELAADLRRFIEDKPIRARRTTPPERLWRWSRRNPALAALLALITFVAVVGLPALAWLWQNSETSRQAELTAKDDLEETLYFNRIALAERKMAAHEILGGLELLDECPEKMRGWEWHYLRQQWLREPIVLRGVSEHGSYSVAFHPNGEQFVTGNGDGSISCWDANSGKVITTFAAHDGHVFSVAISADGKYLLSAAADKTIKAWDWETKRTAAHLPWAQRIGIMASPMQWRSTPHAPNMRPGMSMAT